MAFNKILVPYDGSAQATKAFKQALDIATKFDSEIHVVTSISSALVGAWYKDDKVNKQIFEKAKKYVEGYLKNLEKTAKKKDVKIIMRIVKGDSEKKNILSYSKLNKIDLIVMGSSGKGAFDRFVLGSVSNSVVQKATCPVMIIK